MLPVHRWRQQDESGSRGLLSFCRNLSPLQLSVEVSLFNTYTQFILVLCAAHIRLFFSGIFAAVTSSAAAV